jgi:hypothetical protein
MNFHRNSEEVHYFVIDFFNDLTGVSRYTDKLWDIQAKAPKENAAGAIGRELVTLYKNYVSEFTFDEYILFVGGIKKSILLDNKVTFGIENIKLNEIEKMKKSLIEECNLKKYIDNSKISSENVDAFLQQVKFVIDDKERIEYVKGIIRVKPSILPPDDVLEDIFKQIRDAQSSKKNNGMIEGITIHSPDVFLNYDRHLSANEIRMMALNRIVSYDILNRGIPEYFFSIYNDYGGDSKSMLEDCKLNISKTLFDKNNTESFWELFCNLYDVLTSNKELSINEAYLLLDKTALNRVQFLDILSVKFFMSIIKEAIYAN